MAQLPGKTRGMMPKTALITGVTGQDTPDDYVLATGECHKVREFLELAFAHVVRTIAWKGDGMDETDVDTASEKVLVRVDQQWFRPKEMDHLIGGPSKARLHLGWTHKTTFSELVAEMMDADMAREQGQN